MKKQKFLMAGEVGRNFCVVLLVCLLLYRIGSRVVSPSWCGIGGHFEADELNNPEKCVLRELKEETGITADMLENLQMRYITLRLKNNEIRQNYYFFAELNLEDFVILKCDEGIIEFVDIDKVLDREMPVTAYYCLKHYLENGRHNEKVYAGVASEDGVYFEELAEF